MSEIMHEALKDPKGVRRYIRKLKEAETEIKKKNKFLVINRKFLVGLQGWEMEDLHLLLGKLHRRYPALEKNKYIVCNQDEPYAEEVWQVILEGERKKKEKA